MSNLSEMVTLVQNLNEAAHEVIEVDRLRAEHSQDASYNRMMDNAIDRLKRAKLAFEEWQNWDRIAYRAKHQP